MFTNLIESDSHRKEFKRRSSFFLVTVAGYALFIFAAAIAGVLTYDARVEAQTSSLELLEWVPPVAPDPNPEPPRETRVVRPARQPNAPVDPNVRVSERTSLTAPASDPTKIPDQIGTVASSVPEVRGPVVLSNRNVNPPSLPGGDPNGCLTCSGSKPVVPVDETAPPATPPVKPPATHRVSTGVLISKIIALPKPVYPTMAKQLGAQGSVNVQILVDESGKVISAHVVKGHPALTHAAVEAARRARFTPTLLNNQPVKVQGVITYNFVLQ